jgi:hypothetical protein
MTPFTMVAASLIGIVSVARTVRLLIYDEFPPVEWLRVRLIALLGDTWGKVLTCPFCLAPYLATGLALWAWWSDLNTFWWVVNGVWAASYVAAVIVAYDEPEG